MNPHVLVIGLGNPDRGDDALGREAARRLAENPQPGIKIIQRDGGGLGLLDDWNGYNTVLLLDAAAPCGQPGHIHRINLSEQKLPPGFSSNSTHGLGIAEAVQMATALGRLPPQLIIYAVEGKSFDFGAPLTPKVAAAMPELLSRLHEELAQHS
jgi:hydrogenase maturation protease